MASSRSSYTPLLPSHGIVEQGQNHELECINAQHEPRAASLDTNYTPRSTVAELLRPDNESGKSVRDVHATSF